MLHTRFPGIFITRLVCIVWSVGKWSRKNDNFRLSKHFSFLDGRISWWTSNALIIPILALHGQLNQREASICHVEGQRLWYKNQRSESSSSSRWRINQVGEQLAVHVHNVVGLFTNWFIYGIWSTKSALQCVNCRVIICKQKLSMWMRTLKHLSYDVSWWINPVCPVTRPGGFNDRPFSSPI